MYLTFFEGMALAANQGNADDETLRKCFRGILLSYYLGLDGWIHKMQAVTNRPGLYAQIETLSNRWKVSDAG